MIDVQFIMQLQQMMQSGAQLKDIFRIIKTKNFTPETIENILCELSPEIKKAKQAIQNSGMSTNEYLNQLVKQNNINPTEFNNFMGNINKLIGQ